MAWSRTKIARRAGTGLLAAATVLVVLRAGIGIYLRTGSGRAVVSDQFGAQIGLPVDVSGVALGLRQTSIKFRVLDPALDDQRSQPILSVGKASADVTLESVLTGRASPHEVHLSDVAVHFRLGANGTILSTLPQLPESSGGGETEIPLVTLDRVTVHIRQEGRPEFILTGLSLRAEPSGDAVILSGAIDDPA